MEEQLEMTKSRGIDPDVAILFLFETAQYFERRGTGGEDKAHWANVYNAEMCRKISQLIMELTDAERK
jgi:hypothetical protein